MDRYAGGFLWQREITSNYPEEGLRIPYHIYKNDPQILEKIVVYPENSRNFKYGTRHISDDDALVLIEQLIEVVGTLKEIGDTTENWDERIRWLNSLIAELWTSRGAYPGLANVMDAIGFHEAITYFKENVVKDSTQEELCKKSIFDFLNDETDEIPGIRMGDRRKRDLKRRWKLKTDPEKNLLENVLIKFHLTSDQMAHIRWEKREEYGINASLEEIGENPYLLTEQYIGEGPDDVISFNKIDHGIFPSPDISIGERFDFEVDDAYRLRALCVEQLKRDQPHTFQSVNQIIHAVNHRLSYLPEWKRHQFNDRYFEVDKEILSESLTMRTDHEGEQYLYLKTNYDDERLIESQLRNLANRPDIEFRRPLTKETWKGYLMNSDSPIIRADPNLYDEILSEQAEICARLFVKPLSIISGGAGTGKTTLIKAIINAIRVVDGRGSSIQLLAPTGKAADRVREITGGSASTIHSVLAKHGWLLKNFGFRRKDGSQASFSTVIIDESSMLDLSLIGTLVKCINWHSVKRLILIGDPNQLPPIGYGKIFSELIDWLNQNYPENLGVLQTNIRQLLNKIEDRGTGILDLASLYTRSSHDEPDRKHRTETMIKKIQLGGEIDQDLRVLYWKDYDELQEVLLDQITQDIEQDLGEPFDSDRFELWSKAFNIEENGKQEPDYMQIISPYRGEFYGVDSVNSWIQQHFNTRYFTKNGTVAGITYYDKVIQIRNRPKSNQIWAWNTRIRKNEQIEVYNGEIGFVKPHAFDSKRWFWNNFRPRRVQVTLQRKQHYWIDFRSQNQIEENLELAYAVSVHKAQGSEFQRVYFILPKSKKSLLTTELLYTGITRAETHTTLLIEEDHTPLLSLLRPENSQLNKINSSLFEFKPIPQELLSINEWYEEGKIHRTLTNEMVRSKSETIIANMLFERDIPFTYETPLYAKDGTFFLPDFTIQWQGQEWYWEHLGMLHDEGYRNHWETKKQWYQDNGFYENVITSTEEKGIDSPKIQELIDETFS